MNASVKVVRLITLAGTLATGGVHLHMSVSDAQGRAEGWVFDRTDDPLTGYLELAPRQHNDLK